MNGKILLVPRALLVVLGALCIVAAGGAFTSALAKVDVVTMTPDLAAIAREVGGDKVDVESLARGTQDPHFADPKPSFILKLDRADLYVKRGLELEVGWSPVLENGSRNPRILGGPGFVDAFVGIPKLEVSLAGMDSRALGDVHPLGNPHDQRDPVNAKTMARTSSTASAGRSLTTRVLQQRPADFDRRIDEQLVQWQTEPRVPGRQDRRVPRRLGVLRQSIRSRHRRPDGTEAGGVALAVAPRLSDRPDEGAARQVLLSSPTIPTIRPASWRRNRGDGADASRVAGGIRDRRSLLIYRRNRGEDRRGTEGGTGDVMQSLIELERATLGDGRHAVLEEATLAAASGDFLGIVGLNGSAKTTPLKTMLGTLRPLSRSRLVAEQVAFGYVPGRQAVDDTSP